MFCESAKKLSALMAAHERICDLLMKLVQEMPAMCCAIMADLNEQGEGSTLFVSALSAFGEAAKIQAMFRKVSLTVEEKQHRYSPVYWLNREAERFMQSTSALFAAVAKASTTMRRRKDLSRESAQKYITSSGGAVWEIASGIHNYLERHSLETFSLRPFSEDETQYKLDYYEQYLQSFLALIYDAFFDERRNSPNGIMVSYAARSGLFDRLYDYLRMRVESTQFFVKRTQLDTTECYQTMRCFARLFAGVSDVKMMTSTNTHKLALSTSLPAYVNKEDQRHAWTQYEHIAEAFNDSRSGIDWIHCSLNDALQCLWAPENEDFARRADVQAETNIPDVFVQCMLHILGGSEQAGPTESRRAAPAPPVQQQEPAQYVPSNEMMDAICEMGFSRGHAHHALVAVRGASVERALEHLLTRPMDDVPVEVPPPPGPEAHEVDVSVKEPTRPTVTQVALNSEHTHAVHGRLPKMDDLVNALYAYHHVSAHNGALLMLKFIDAHQLIGLSRE